MKISALQIPDMEFGEYRYSFIYNPYYPKSNKFWTFFIMDHQDFPPEFAPVAVTNDIDMFIMSVNLKECVIDTFS